MKKLARQYHESCLNCGGSGIVEDLDPEWEEVYMEECIMCDGTGGWWVDVNYEVHRMALVHFALMRWCRRVSDE